MGSMLDKEDEILRKKQLGEKTAVPNEMEVDGRHKCFNLVVFQRHLLYYNNRLHTIINIVMIYARVLVNSDLSLHVVTETGLTLIAIIYIKFLWINKKKNVEVTFENSNGFQVGPYTTSRILDNDLVLDMCTCICIYLAQRLAYSIPSFVLWLLMTQKAKSQSYYNLEKRAG
ncbi:hypothetical protein J3Q64DRAFT_1816692 [Phycomyces blakesleeanus]|uniref:Uncharacterized protein n=1 Tax=Phycomyces blakesleeanus TaxID=4837 RepID=A0ABR3BE33_PHYBL